MASRGWTVPHKTTYWKCPISSYHEIRDTRVRVYHCRQFMCNSPHQQAHPQQYILLFIQCQTDNKQMWYFLWLSKSMLHLVIKYDKCVKQHVQHNIKMIKTHFSNANMKHDSCGKEIPYLIYSSIYLTLYFVFSKVTIFTYFSGAKRAQ